MCCGESCRVCRLTSRSGLGRDGSGSLREAVRAQEEPVSLDVKGS